MKRKVVSISSICIVFLALIIIATIFDLTISKSMSSVTNLGFLVSIGAYGKLPAYVGLVIGSMLVYTGLNERFYNSIFLIIVKLLNITFIALSLFLLFDYIIPFKIVCFVIVVILIIPIIILLEEYKYKLKDLFYFGMFLVFTIVFSAVLIEILKLVMCRERFYVIYNALDYDAFTPWYQCMFDSSIRTKDYLLAHGITCSQWWGIDEFMSFPSGHAGMSAIVLALNVLPCYIEKLKRYKWLIFVTTLLFTVFVCFTRILALMHYMSDVVFGVLITVLSMVVSHMIVSLIKKRVFKDC